MVHTLKKFISNRGAALFMVISTMTALLVSVMAMYFSMVTSRQQQYAVFSKIQASQTAQSVLDVVGAGLRESLAEKFDAEFNNRAEVPKAASALLAKLDNLSIGEAITTDANGFKSLDPNGEGLGKDLDNMGAYAVTITYKGNDAKGSKIFDIAVSASVKGSKDIVHAEIIYAKPESNDSLTDKGGDSRLNDSEIFAATGYVPNDTYTDSGFFLTSTFFDTEYTYVGMFGNSRSILTGNLSTGGSLILDYDFNDTFSSDYQEPFKNLYKRTRWAIRGNLIDNRNSALKFVGGSKVMVGGDFTFTEGGGIASVQDSTPVDLYILGDLNVTGGYPDLSNVNVYIDGDFNNDAGSWLKFKSIHVNGKSNLNGVTLTINGAEGKGVSDIPKWDAAHLEPNGLRYEQVIVELGESTQTNDYDKWIISDKLVHTDKPIKIKLNNYNHALTDSETGEVIPVKTVCTLAVPESESAKNGTADYVADGFTINGFMGSTGGHEAPIAIVIDTGDDPNVALPIRVQPYLDLDGDGTKETFMWIDNINASQDKFAIIVKGRGSVIIDVQDGAVYQDVTYQQFLHYSWFRLLGCTERDENIGGQNVHIYDSYGLGTYMKGKDPIQFMHTKCVAGDGCTYTTEQSSQLCEKCQSTYKTVITCAKHGNVSGYCATCQPGKKTQLDNFNAGSGDGFCNNHVDHDSVDTYLETHSDIKEAISDSKGVIYPNTNIYLVTCSEGTEIRFSDTVNKDAIQHNGFYGFVYAPFITYKGKGGSMVGVTRLLGGMIVSDYVINDNYAFNACYPDRMPQDAANLTNGGKYGGKLNHVEKSWKLKIGKYS